MKPSRDTESAPAYQRCKTGLRHTPRFSVVQVGLAEWPKMSSMLGFASSPLKQGRAQATCHHWQRGERVLASKLGQSAHQKHKPMMAAGTITDSVIPP